MEVETNAFSFMLTLVLKKFKEHDRIIVHTDSYVLWENLQKFRVGHSNLIPFMDMTNMTNSNEAKHIHIAHIRRGLNPRVDFLAKQGMNRPNTIFG